MVDFKILSEVNKLLPNHDNDCMSGAVDRDEGDFCTCNLSVRRKELYKILESKGNK